MKQNRTVLYLGYIWPETRSSAAGLRNWSMAHAFKSRDWRVVYASSAKLHDSERLLREAGFETRLIQPNSGDFDALLLDLQPELVIFDRFLTEEQFSFRVRERIPQALRVVDTIDLHFLRRERERMLKRGEPFEKIFAGKIRRDSEDAIREIASIYRSDLSLVLSDFEMKILEDDFSIPKMLLHECPFLYPEELKRTILGFDARKNFAFIGNFRHAPNSDAVSWLKKELWPMLRERLPEAELHVYGAYPSREMTELDCASEGFRVLGPAEDAETTLGRYRLNLAPLRFGAGIKGKISDGWAAGTPCITTPIGAEGMSDSSGSWGGLVAQNALEWVDFAATGYLDRPLWERLQKKGFELLRTLFSETSVTERLFARVDEAVARRDSQREANIVGNILWHQSHRSTEYFSRWIEAKNRN